LYGLGGKGAMVRKKGEKGPQLNAKDFLGNNPDWRKPGGGGICKFGPGEESNPRGGTNFKGK